uniref:Xylulose kinase n=1 Tax=Timema bartmani TaxID=61472 RepID=A0A7R9FAY2_9NEOP|nr:unnamed protein product [Timema bartmani]
MDGPAPSRAQRPVGVSLLMNEPAITNINTDSRETLWRPPAIEPYQPSGRRLLVKIVGIEGVEWLQLARQREWPDLTAISQQSDLLPCVVKLLVLTLVFQLKGVIINNDLQILHETQVQFDTDLPEFRTHGGVVTTEDGHTITAPTLLWVKALDLLLDQLKLAGADYTSIAAISGTAQQHGSVYWQRGARHTLQSLEASKFLHEQLARSFSTPNSPVWMDSSTTVQCRQLEQAVGGAQFSHSQPTYIFQLSPPPVCELQRVSELLFLPHIASHDGKVCYMRKVFKASPLHRVATLTITQGCHTHHCTGLPHFTTAQGCHTHHYTGLPHSPLHRVATLTTAQGCHTHHYTGLPHSPLHRAATLTITQGCHTHHYTGLPHSPLHRVATLTTAQGCHTHHYTGLPHSPLHRVATLTTAQGCSGLPHSPLHRVATLTITQGCHTHHCTGMPHSPLHRKLAEITGSTAYERFTASQIAKLSQTKPAVYNSTERISLVSSFACSLFLGDYADIDYSDGSGMNLLDIHSKDWSQICLDATAPNLIDKLGTPVASSSIQGPISQYFVERFDFNPDCKVASFTGDNPASLIGMCLTEGNIAVSLGTSDTLFLWLRSPQTLLEGHILCNPVDKEAYMALLCFKNGSLTRERVRDDCAEGSWELFNELLDSTPRGNFGNMGLYFDVQEIIPFVKGDHRFNKANDRVHRFTSMEVEVRALVEGQFLAKRAHAEDLGFNIEAGSRIIATGGASNNKSILQVLSDVFNAPVFVLEAANSAMLGSAYQAKHALVAEHTSFSEMTSCLSPPVLACQPYKDAAQVYNPMLARYRRLVKSILDTT